MKIATWNVNSVRARLQHLAKYLDYAKPDVLCLQETKVEDGLFPAEEVAGMGYAAIYSGQKSYNGVAILSRLPGAEVSRGFAHLPEDHPLNAEKRLIQATFGGIRVISAYVPNGEEAGSLKYSAKLEFIGELRRFTQEVLSSRELVVMCGDFNVAMEPADLHDPSAFAGQVPFTDAEREGMKRVAAAGLSDCFRMRHPEPGRYSWWDYRGALFWKGIGMRLDHIWASGALAARLADCDIDARPRRWPKPSDHAPVWAQFDV